MSELDRLILVTEKSISINNDFIKEIEHPKLFLSALKELKDLVGNDTIKDSIATQIMHLLSMKNVKKDINAAPVMLNTMLYGPPGTGKTAIATKLAKIWYAMGFIHGEKANTTTSYLYSLVNAEYFTLYAYVLFYICYVIYKAFKDIDISESTFRYSLILGAIIILIIIGVIWYTNSNYYNNVNNGLVKDTDIITIVSREDFVDKYLGGTDKKTKDLLQANTGKVLFIDEAYSLYNSSHDPYGMEAITTMNRYLSEHPDKLFVIMAGYKDLIQDGIFTAQPGLPSRFMWQFECDGYNAKELYHIFLVMVKKDGWSFNPKQKKALYDLFSKNKTIFKAYGRDIQRLLFFSQLEYSKNKISNDDIKELELTIDMVEKGLTTLVRNNINKDDKPTHNMKDLFDLFDTTRTKEVDSFLPDSSVLVEDLDDEESLEEPMSEDDEIIEKESEGVKDMR